MSVTSAEVHALARYRAEFPIFQQKTYLNTCSLGALGRRSRQRLESFLQQWEERGAAAWYDVWWGSLAELRRRYARLIGARETEIALHASVSTATAVLASALHHNARSKVVTTSLDFPTVAYQWLAKADAGIEVVVVESPDGVSVPLDTLAKAVDDRTALVATSHVCFTSGWIQDIRAVADLAHSKGAFCYIDAYQSVGQIPIDVHDTGVDFLSAGGLKWLLGGPGIVFLYVREELIDRLTPTVTGWFAHERQFEFDPRSIQWHRDARRFEQGTPGLAAVHTQLGGLDVVEEIGLPVLRAVTQDLTEELIRRATSAGLNPRVASKADQRSAIVMIPRSDPADTVRQLADADIIVDARPGHVRISPFFYNLPEDYDTAIGILSG